MDAEIDLSDSTVIIAGGGRGLGEATAKEFANYGASVVVNDLGTSSEGEGSDPEPAATQTVTDIEEAGGTAKAHFGDISDVNYCEELVADAVERYDSLDTVINFAGILRDNFLVNMTEEDWDQVIQVHLKGHFALMRAAARHWREVYKEADGFDSEKSFISVSSAAARGNPGQINYSAAKGGILGLMRTGARELQRYDVRVNALMPVAYTRMVDGIPDEHLPDVDPKVLAPDRVAPMAVFLGSAETEGVTGCTFACGGEAMMYVTDPELRTAAYNTGGWSVESIANRFDQLTDNQETSNTEPGGILHKVV
jgi:NAD(P)-dependent dehydrogenase (short-subunit alcohol dehydrogenase family)